MSGTTSDLITGAEALRAAQEFCQEQGIPLPPIPVEFEGQLRCVTPNETPLFYTSETAPALGGLEVLASEARGSARGNSLAFGVVGSGVQSWYWTYALETEHLALFVRVLFGGLYTDLERSRESVGGAVDLIAAVLEVADQIAWTENERLVVLDAETAGFVGWASAAGFQPVETEMPFVTALAELHERKSMS